MPTIEELRLADALQEATKPPLQFYRADTMTKTDPTLHTEPPPPLLTTGDQAS